MYDPTNGIPDTYTFALNIEGNAPFYINEVEWISKDNHKVITDQYQDRLEIMNTQNSETKPHIVQYIKVKVQNSSKAVIRGTLTIKYVDAFGKERKVESPELFLNKNKISNSKYLYYKYFV
ncbi:hypothetical protein D2M30_2259 [Bacillus amyloliquefaciens]|nr:hypothetical protein D2M30_1289 [Bacillus amyloliquefaciens]QBG56588.1 hypothetical protein D2M30_2259 [Bacillus amyloliquefaciens]